jgi:tRNA nucleotidyltransferase (CCA-adding enzyme)
MKSSAATLRTPEQWLSRLPAWQRAICKEAIEAARLHGISLYLVGGTVRDLLLGLECADLDLAAEGEVRELGREVCDALGLQLHWEQRFLTARLNPPKDCRRRIKSPGAGSQGFTDIATARSEFYPRPGALPQVAPAAIEQDLGRRDFTVNAIAVGLAGRHAGELLDPFSGSSDLKRSLVRVLHNLSFRDDPTRVLRGVRLAGRLGMKFERKTLGLARLACRAGALETVSADRLRRELLLLFAEPSPVACLRAAQKAGVLTALLRRKELRTSEWRALRAAEAFLRWARKTLPEIPLEASLIYLCLLPGGCRLAEKLGFRPRWTELLKSFPMKRRSIVAALSAPSPRPSSLARRLDSIAAELILAAAASASSRHRLAAKRYLARVRQVEPLVTGMELRRMGFEPGPEIGSALRALRYARLDGEARSREQQLATAKRILRKVGQD